ncbi:MAG: Nramp family divalent metal transporter [Nitrosomonadales bacterium]
MKKIVNFEPFPGLLKVVGPGFIWMALAQGSGELIWWPYLIAKYGTFFLSLLIPACLLQWPINYEIGKYTLITGESIFTGFYRIGKNFSILLWLLMIISFLWFGAFASAGGTALAELTNFPSQFSLRGQTFFWGALSILFFYIIVMWLRSTYSFIESFMTLVALVTFFGLIWAVSDPSIFKFFDTFFVGLYSFPTSLPKQWDNADATKLITAISFAGLGGFWILFYSYWLQSKGLGLSKNDSHHNLAIIPANSDNFSIWKKWLTFLRIDISIGVFGNIFTTLLMCFLSLALLNSKNLIPDGFQIASVQSEFFILRWGGFGKYLFLFIAAAFLADTWLATADAFSRINCDFLPKISAKANKLNKEKRLYKNLFTIITLITFMTMFLDQPGSLIQLSALIGFVGTLIFPIALYYLNYCLLPKQYPDFLDGQSYSKYWLLLVFIVYTILLLLFLYFKFLI